MPKIPATGFTITDDVDGAELDNDTQPIRLSLGNDTWSLYLSDKHAGELYDALHKFTEKAEKVNRPVSRSTAASSGGGRGKTRSQEERDAEAKQKADKQAQREEIVAWGKKNAGDYKVNDSGRGRLDGKLVAAFYDGNKDAEKLH